MIINQWFMICFYFLSVLLFFNFNSPFIFWMLTEINLLIFICLLVSFNGSEYKKEFHDLLLFYFIVQSVASIFFLMDFFFSMDMMMFNMDLMFILSMLIKLGMFPFFFWIFKICNYLNYSSLGLLLSIQKIPFFLAIYSSFSPIMFILILSSFVVGSVMILFSDNLIHMLVCSSITYSFWSFYIHSLSMYLFLIFFFIYGVMILLLLKSYSSSMSLDSMFKIMLFMFLLGLSPFSIFFFKILSVFLLDMNYGLFEFLTFWIFSFLTLLGYSKFSFNSFFQKLYCYNEIGVSKNMQILFYGISSIFFFLFLC